MNDYSKYVLFSNSSDKKGDEQVLTIHPVREITEQSTPKEMSQFVSQKLIESIEEDLRAKNVFVVS